ncbi:unnamed protein product [Rotaria sp. Silwood1]|nr:unnamed protein product [Rotaria sp. Silwood1]CAF3570598.1 unnamed protein product [Rotaria sp. Silwood1]CAF4766694.1 unnamed protein product [Rotaria sp. Silwood1]CAF4832720.1 unnamed protein product [Rotaria sp. Silwood1]
MIKSTAKAQTLSTVPCKPVLNYYFKYLTAPHPGINRYFPIQATFILQVTVSFSDRTWTPSCSAFFCPIQIFNYKNTDIQTIIINRLGSIQYISNSWGNAKFKDQLQCYGINKPFYTAPTKQS